MDIQQFMQGYKRAWENRDPALFCALFKADGVYRKTPFAVQRGHGQLARYSKEPFRIWAASTGTNRVAQHARPARGVAAPVLRYLECKAGSAAR